MFIGFEAEKEYKVRDMGNFHPGDACWDDGDPREIKRFENEEDAKKWLELQESRVKRFKNAGIEFCIVTEYYYSEAILTSDGEIDYLSGDAEISTFKGEVE